MPCYLRQVGKVDLQNANHDLLEKSLKKKGFDVRRNKVTGAFSFSKDNIVGRYDNKQIVVESTDGKKPNVDQIKEDYSEEVVRAQADKFRAKGWNVSKENGEWKFSRNRQSRKQFA